MKHGAAIDARDKEDWTSLHFATEKDKEAVAQLLLEHGAAVNTQRWDGYLPLHVAAQKGKKHMTRLLLKYGAQITIKDNLGKTPIDIARLFRHTELLPVLSTPQISNRHSIKAGSVSKV